MLFPTVRHALSKAVVHVAHLTRKALVIFGPSHLCELVNSLSDFREDRSLELRLIELFI